MKLALKLYQRILAEAVEELKEEKFNELFGENSINENKIINFQIDTDLEILFPDTYINNIKERLNQYQKLSEIKTNEELNEFTNILEDRFGKLPNQTIDLVKTIELKWLGIEIGFEKIILKNNKIDCQFISNKEDSYYQEWKI